MRIMSFLIPSKVPHTEYVVLDSPVLSSTASSRPRAYVYTHLQFVRLLIRVSYLQLDFVDKEKAQHQGKRNSFPSERDP